jgi:hypothetical protein
LPPPPPPPAAPVALEGPPVTVPVTVFRIIGGCPASVSKRTRDAPVCCVMWCCVWSLASAQPLHMRMVLGGDPATSRSSLSRTLVT